MSQRNCEYLNEIRLLGLIICLCSAVFSPLSWANEWLDQAVTPEDARHLLARTGFDASPESQLTIVGRSRQKAINLVLAGFNTRSQRPMPAWTQDVAPLYWARRDLNDEGRREFDRLRNQELASLRMWWVNEMLTTSSPQTERMVLFWHDHFATSYHGINRQSMAMARQNQTFRKLGMGKFDTLLRAMIRDPALLAYLNNTTNRKSHPNENLARELMELFTLGEGNFDESTVKEAARALTGYGVSQNRNLQASFNDWQHDWDVKTLFGETGAFNGDDLITILLKQPALDRHIATRVWHFLVSDRSPTHDEIAPLATAFRRSDHRLDVLYKAVLESEAFWAEEQRGALIKSPVTLLIGTARSLDTPKRINEKLPRLLELAGQDLLAPPNVSGWEEGPAWITTGRLLNRYTGLKALLASTRKQPAIQSTGPQAGMMAAPNDMTQSENNMMSNLSSMDASGDDQAALQLMDEPTMMPSNTSSIPLSLSLAGENLGGPPRYWIELLGTNNQSLWQSAIFSLKGGWDTARFGPITERSQLPWQTIRLSLPASRIRSASFFRIHYVNDAANDVGDRNLYVGALRQGDVSLLPTAGTQISDCVPENPAAAGDLYCQGSVDIALDSLKLSDAKTYDQDSNKRVVRYASKHIGWVGHNKKNGVLNARIVFQDLRYGERHWPVFSAWYRVQPDGDPALWLSREECWPDCVKQWPDCAWSNEKAPNNLTLAFTALGAREDTTLQCHIDSLQDDEAALIDGLLIHADSLLSDSLVEEKARFPFKRAHVKQGLMLIIQRLREQDIVQALSKATPTSRTAREDVPRVVQDASAKRSYPEFPDELNLPIRADSLKAREQQLHSQGFSWQTVLAPGIALSKLPGWSGDSTDVKEGTGLYKRVQDMLLNPIYQVY